MSQNADLILTKESKEKMVKVKKSQKKNFVEQTKSILSFYKKMSVEELAKIIINEYPIIQQNKDKVKMTVAVVNIESELLYLRKIHDAILTKLPNIEFKEMLLILFNHYLNNSNITNPD